MVPGEAGMSGCLCFSLLDQRYLRSYADVLNTGMEVTAACSIRVLDDALVYGGIPYPARMHQTY